AGDAVWAARLIERHFDSVLQQGQRATIHRWLAVLPADLVHARARLVLAQAWMAVVGGYVEAAGVALDAAHRHPLRSPRSHSSHLRAGARACWPTRPRRSPSVKAGSRGCAATPIARPLSRPRHSVS